MKVLLDTNLLIGREDPSPLSPDLAKLLRILSANAVTSVIHPDSLVEINGDHDEERRRLVLSKIQSYPLLVDPPSVGPEFVEQAGGRRSTHDGVDIALLRCVDANAVSFLVTEDQDLVARGPRLGLEDRVLNVASAVEYFSQYFGRVYPAVTPYIARTHLYKLNIRDRFFDSFRKDYSGFDQWFGRAAADDRLCYASRLPGGHVGSILILKDSDNEPICGLPATPRLKICSMKVSEEQGGFRLGETLVAIALDYASQNRVSEVFVTVFPNHGELIALLSTFGFEPRCTKPNGEIVLVKSLDPPQGAEAIPPEDFLSRFFPVLRDDPSVRKFLVPIRPDYHRLLFPRYGITAVQTTLDDSVALPPPAGNAIRKAYLCRSRTGRVRPGDLLLFYRSSDFQSVTHLGVVERIDRCTSVEQVVDLVGNRTVLPRRKLEELCSGSVLALLFWNAGALSHQVPLTILEQEGVSWPQSVTELDHHVYQRLLKEGGARRSFFR